MRSLITSVLLGVGVLGATAIMPQQANAMGPWHPYHGRYVGHYHPYYRPGINFIAPTYVALPIVEPAVIVPPVVGPTVAAPVIAPYASFSVGDFGRWGGAYWHGGHYYYHRR